MPSGTRCAVSTPTITAAPSPAAPIRTEGPTRGRGTGRVVKRGPLAQAGEARAAGVAPLREAVRVVSAGGACRGADHEEPERGLSGLLEQVAHELEVGSGGVARARDDDDPVDLIGDPQRVAHLAQRGRVEDHVIRELL